LNGELIEKGERTKNGKIKISGKRGKKIWVRSGVRVRLVSYQRDKMGEGGTRREPVAGEGKDESIDSNHYSK